MCGKGSRPEAGASVHSANHCNLIYREEEREMLPLCRAEGIAVIPWSPLARGRLAREWDAGTERSETDAFGCTMYAGTVEADRQVVDVVGEVARERGVPRAQVALAWVAGRPGITAPIVGATKAHHLEDAVAALELELTADEVARLEKAYVPHPVLGFA